MYNWRSRNRLGHESFKGHVLCPFLQSLVSPECVCEVSKYPTGNLLYNLENDSFEWKQKHIFMPVSLNPNELLLLPPFQNRAAPFQLVPAKNICFGSDYHVYCTEIMRFKPY